MMNHDISQILDDWKYDIDSNVRRIRGDDGVAKVQVRVDQGAFQGILQLNLDGRPDGKRPRDRDFALDHYRDTLVDHERRAGGEEGFQLDHPSCEELFEEAAQIYGRYAFLLQIKDYERVIRDTERNMGCFEFFHQFAAFDDDRMNLQKWWPYIIRIHADGSGFAVGRRREVRACTQDLECIQATN